MGPWLQSQLWRAVVLSAVLQCHAGAESCFFAGSAVSTVRAALGPAVGKGFCWSALSVWERLCCLVRFLGSRVANLIIKRLVGVPSKLTVIFRA